MIEKFERYIIRLKKKANPKVVSVTFFIIFGVCVIFGLDMSNHFKRQKDLVQDEYNRSMYEMIGYIKNVDLQLLKLQIVSDRSLMTTTLADIWRQSNLAKENLANLPVQQDKMSNTSKFLAQVSDFSYYLMKETAKGKEVSHEQYEQLVTLSKNASDLLDVSARIYEDLNTGALKWDEVEKAGNASLDQDVAVASIADLSKLFQDYEGLIYDGAFSDHILQVKPKALSEKLVTQEEAKQTLVNAFGENTIENITFMAESNSNLEVYQFNVKLKESQMTRNVSVTKLDGKFYFMLSDREVAEQKITVDKAKKIGKEFLEKIGIDNMQDTYYLITENLVTINYAAKQDNVILYPDLVKVKVALDNGEICSLETSGYTFNHTTRENLTPTKTLNQAKEKLNPYIEVDSEQLAIIPTEYKSELLVYEFKGTLNDIQYIIYINAETLIEEKVLMIIDTPNGTLTM